MSRTRVNSMPASTRQVRVSSAMPSVVSYAQHFELNSSSSTSNVSPSSTAASTSSWQRIGMSHRGYEESVARPPEPALVPVLKVVLVVPVQVLFHILSQVLPLRDARLLLMPVF